MSNWELVGKILCKHVEEDFGIWTEGAVYKVYKRPDRILLYDDYQNTRLSKSIESFIEEMSKGCVIFEEVKDTKRVNPNVLRCVEAGDYGDWWTSGKLYPITHERTHVYIVDDEGDERFLAGQTLEEAIIYQKDYYGTVFEPVYAETSDEDLIERIKKEIERLNKDQENLFGKRDRINGQAIQLGVKARKLEEVLEVLEEYK